MRFTEFAAILLTPLLLLTGCGSQSFSHRKPDELLRSGAEMVASFSFFEAEDRLRKARALFPKGSEEWQQATYLLALSLRHQTPASAVKIGEAYELLEGLLTDYPDSRYAPDALMILARIDELRDFPGDPADPAAAATRYQRLVERYPDSDLADLAVLRLASQGTLDPANVEAARASVAMIEKRIAQRPNSPYLWAMWEFLVSTNRLLLKDEAAALRAMIEAERHSLTAEGRRGDMFWNIAVLAESLGELEIAQEYYQRLYERAKRNLRNTEAGERLQALRLKQKGKE